jgi:hypothetical protein
LGQAWLPKCAQHISARLWTPPLSPLPPPDVSIPPSDAASGVTDGMVGERGGGGGGGGARHGRGVRTDASGERIMSVIGVVGRRRLGSGGRSLGNQNGRTCSVERRCSVKGSSWVMVSAADMHHVLGAVAEGGREGGREERGAGGGGGAEGGEKASEGRGAGEGGARTVLPRLMSESGLFCLYSRSLLPLMCCRG